MEHYSDLYSRRNVVATAALDAIECLPVMEELDTEPTIEEHIKAIDSLASGKASDSDGTPPPPRPDQALQEYPSSALARSPLPVLERRGRTTGHEVRQDHHPLQEQGRT